MKSSDNLPTHLFDISLSACFPALLYVPFGIQWFITKERLIPRSLPRGRSLVFEKFLWKNVYLLGKIYVRLKNTMFLQNNFLLTANYNFC